MKREGKAAARELINQADRIAREQGFTQAQWCRDAGFDEFGKRISNAYRRGDCYLETFYRMLAPLGYEAVIVKAEETIEND